MQQGCFGSDSIKHWDTVSFGLLDDVGGKWTQATQKLQEFMDKLGKSLRNYAWVETTDEKKLLARTVVSWTGDLKTTWWVRPDRKNEQMHTRTIKLAFATCATILRTFAVITASAIEALRFGSNPCWCDSDFAGCTQLHRPGAD